VNAAVLVQIDQVGGAGDAAEGRLSNGPRWAGKREHHPVVNRIGVAIQDQCTADIRDRGLDRIHDVRSATLAEVRHALDERLGAAAYHAGALKHSDGQSILDLTVRDLLEALGSSEPTPGGGAAAALAGALGAALVQMTANLTLGRPRWAEVQDQARAVEERAAGLRARLEQLADADAQAYGSVNAAYRLPRDTDGRRASRTAAIQQALAGAAAVPLDVAQTCAALLSVCEAAAPVLNSAVISDVMVGALLGRAGLEAAAVNVEVNLASLDDATIVSNLRQALDRACAGAVDRTQRVLDVGRSRFGQ
jgi:formiminotetrahydrofolate cyclodeaminase